MRILNRTRNLPDGWEITDHVKAPAALQKRVNVGVPLEPGSGPLWTTQVSIGTPVGSSNPPPSFTVLIDTGSTDLWVPDIQCGNACQGKKTYDASKSTTSTQIRGERYTHAYSDGLDVGNGLVYDDAGEYYTDS